ncbi:MAG: CBS domain-containing protein [Proteobacteria bacterium]|nr:CBS domain-containing protein [Pseudomonadota bacterium]
MEKITVADLMTEIVVFARENDTLDAAYDAMEENKIRHLPVVDSERSVVGVLSQRDMVAAALFSKDSLPFSQLRDYLRNTTVAEVMSRGVEVTDPEESIREAGLKLLENKFGCLPVVEGQTLIGILTESDFVRYLSEMEESTGQRLGRHLKTG